MLAKALDLAIQKDNSIHNVEDYLSKLGRDVTKVTVKLPRHHKMTFFKDAWISSLITTASFGRELVITDWNNKLDYGELRDRFSNSLIGITSAFLAQEINNVSHQKFDFHIKDIVDRIVFDYDGMIEDHESGKSFVFCSFDSPEENFNYPKPFALSASSKEEFIRKFLDIKREKVDYQTAGANSYQLAFTHESDIDLATLIFELYENTNQHGKYDENNNVIRGVRSFSIKRHSSSDTAKLLDQAKPFTELETYINELKQKRNLHFYEISIADNGIGIINRLKATRPDLYAEQQLDKLSDTQKLNCIISKNLSSKLYPGSGLGLTLALKNLQNKKGFLSLRTGDQWVYFDGATGKIDSEFPLQSVGYKENLSSIKGTFYNILIPVS